MGERTNQSDVVRMFETEPGKGEMSSRSSSCSTENVSDSREEETSGCVDALYIRFKGQQNTLQKLWSKNNREKHNKSEEAPGVEPP